MPVPYLQTKNIRKFFISLFFHGISKAGTLQCASYTFFWMERNLYDRERGRGERQIERHIVRRRTGEREKALRHVMHQYLPWPIRLHSPFVFTIKSDLLWKIATRMWSTSQANQVLGTRRAGIFVRELFFSLLSLQPSRHLHSLLAQQLLPHTCT